MSRNPWWISKIWPTLQAKSISNLTNSSDAMILVDKWEITFRFYFCVKGEGRLGGLSSHCCFEKVALHIGQMLTKTKPYICVLDFSSALQSDAKFSEVDTPHFLPSVALRLWVTLMLQGKDRALYVESTGLKWDGSLCNSHRRHTGERFSSEWEMEKLPCNL